MNILQNFYGNEAQREAVKAYMIETLAELAVERTFEGKDVGGIKDAKECVDKMFDKLEVTYGKVKQAVNISPR